MIGRPVNGSRPLVRGREADGGGLTKVMPWTVGDTDGLPVAVGGVDAVGEFDDAAVTDGLVVVVGGGVLYRVARRNDQRPLLTQ